MCKMILSFLKLIITHTHILVTHISSQIDFILKNLMAKRFYIRRNDLNDCIMLNGLFTFFFL